ncbi:MAG: YjgN family protein [Arenicella sp.]
MFTYVHRAKRAKFYRSNVIQRVVKATGNAMSLDNINIPSQDDINIPRNAKIERFTFTGSGGEYFKIWIVNILLTIVTLGIYSAWAKVRNKQYFYGNTYLAGSAFEYTAEPIQILKGRIIAIAFYIAYEAAASFYTPLYFAFLLILIIVTPWIIVKSLSFNARYSQYRNVRFSFQQNFKSAYLVFFLIPLVLLLPVLVGIIAMMAFTQVGGMSPALEKNLIYAAPLSVLVSLLAYPYVVYKTKRFIVENHSFGQTQFTSKLSNEKPFYGIYLKAYGAALLTFGTFFAILYAFGDVSTISILTRSTGLPLWASLLVSLGSITAYALLFAYISSQVYNLVYQTSKVGDNKFRARMDTKSLAILYVTNTIGIILTLGFFIPWAKVRTAQYRADKTALQVNRNLEEFITNKQVEQAAFGEEFGDVFDIDVAI